MSLILDEPLADVGVVHGMIPDDCFPNVWCFKRCRWANCLSTWVGRKWWSLRCYANLLVDHQLFESFVILLIVGSSLTLVNTRALSV